MSELLGVNIKEVWDYRLSSAIPQIDTRSGKWIVQIWPKDNSAGSATPLEEHDTGIVATEGDERDQAKVKTCFEWLLTRRDSYALPGIEEMKPEVAKINQATANLAEMQKGAKSVQDSLDEYKAMTALKEGGE